MAWTKLVAKDELADGDVLGVEIGEKKIAVFFHDGEYFATSNVCTHQYALLSDGYFEDGCIECPLHQGRFDIRTGKAMCAPLTEDVKTFPVTVEGDNVMVDLG